VRASEHHGITLARARLDIFVAYGTTAENVGVGATRAGDRRFPHKIFIAVGEDLSSPFLEEGLGDAKCGEFPFQHFLCGEHTLKMGHAVTETLEFLLNFFVDWREG